MSDSPSAPQPSVEARLERLAGEIAQAVTPHRHDQCDYYTLQEPCTCDQPVRMKQNEAKVLKLLLAALTAEARETGWQSIESAPEAERVYVYVPNLGAVIAQKTTHPSDGAVWWDGEEVVSNPTLWHRLPPLPARTLRPSGDRT